MLDQLEILNRKAASELEAASTGAELDAWEKQYLGRKGEITLLTRRVGELEPADRPAFGKRANQIKQDLTADFEQRKAVSKPKKWNRHWWKALSMSLCRANR